MENINKRKTPSVAETALYALSLGTVFFIGFMLIRFPSVAARGVTDGMELCVNTLIPSVFPFMFVSCLLLESGILGRTGKLFDFVGEKVFGLPGVCVPVIFFSMVAGLPVGAKLTEELYGKGMITKTQRQRMLFFCMNPGPAFVITGVGMKMLGSRELGIIIYVSLIISSLLIGILSVPVWSDGVRVEKKISEADKPDIASATVKAVYQSSYSVFSICAWVILFSCLTELIRAIGLSESTENFLLAVTEVTNGCNHCSEIYPAPIIAAIIGFGGFCAHMQVFSSVMKLRLEYKYFISARILNAGISVLFSMFLLKVFPITVETASMGEIPEKATMAMSLPVCAGVMIMCFLLLLGDNYRIKKSVK